jgi:primosomal protein N' (replication factor Y)
LIEIQTALQNQQKVVLFHNRKGYARRVICGDCRHLWECHECGSSVNMDIGYWILDKNENRTIIKNNQKQKQELRIFCPHCQTKISLTQCPQCQGTKWKFFTYGLQKIKEDLRSKIPNLKIKTITADKNPISNIQYLISNKFDIILSTQLPRIDASRPANTIALAAILNIDTNFYLPDFNSSLKTFNRIIAFKKFCRELKIKKSIIQTYSIENEVIRAGAQADFNKFRNLELKRRRELNYPPYSQLIKLIYQHKNKSRCQQEAQKLYNQLISNIKYQNIKISPPQPTFTPKIRGNFRYQIIIKGIRNKELQNMLKTLSPAWLIDVDPISLL